MYCLISRSSVVQFSVKVPPWSAVRTYSFFKGERKLGEQQLEALQVTDEYGVHLTEITLEAESPLPLRQVKKEV